MKANSNQAVLRTLSDLGAGMDVVSEGELRRARAAGVPANKILFSGVGKTEAEQAYALEQDILCFNVESEPELVQLSRVASQMGKAARVSLRINPDVDAKTHAKISTARLKTSSAFPGSVRVKSMPMHPSYLGSKFPVSICISGRKLSNCSHLTMLLLVSAN